MKRRAAVFAPDRDVICIVTTPCSVGGQNRICMIDPGTEGLKGEDMDTALGTAKSLGSVKHKWSAWTASADGAV